MTCYYVPESTKMAVSSVSPMKQSVKQPISQPVSSSLGQKSLRYQPLGHRRTIILQMTQVACQELYFGHVRSALDSLRIVLSLVLGGRRTGLM